MDCLPAIAEKKHAVFVFGRFQPPTIGHGLLIKKLEEKVAEGDCDGYVCLSKTKNIVPNKTLRSGPNKEKYNRFTRSVRTGESTRENRNPLDASTRVKFLKLMYPNTPVKFINGEKCDYTSAAFIAKLKEIGYTDITILVGSDRAESFDSFSSDIWIEKVGEERTSNFKGDAVGMSGTAMRNAAIKGNFELFKRGCKMGAMTDADVKELMDAVRLGMGFTTLLRSSRVNRKPNSRYVWQPQFKQTWEKRKRPQKQSIETVL
jgi:hypothetical protein